VTSSRLYSCAQSCSRSSKIHMYCFSPKVLDGSQLLPKLSIACIDKDRDMVGRRNDKCILSHLDFPESITRYLRIEVHHIIGSYCLTARSLKGDMI
jgi:hypothetical protein